MRDAPDHEAECQYLLEQAAQHVKAAITILRNINFVRKQPANVPKKYWKNKLFSDRP